MTHLTCPCGASKDIENTSNVGEMKKASGFMPVFTHSQEKAVIWVCPTCRAKLVPAVKTIAQVFGLETERLSWYAFWKAITRT